MAPFGPTHHMMNTCHEHFQQKDENDTPTYKVPSRENKHLLQTETALEHLPTDVSVEYVAVSSWTAQDSQKHQRRPSILTKRKLSHRIQRIRLPRAWVDSWAAEFASCIAAVCVLAGLCITLWSFQGRALAKITLGVSPNTTIAIFSTILKALLLKPVAEGISQLKWLWFSSSKPLLDFMSLDLASRGPWGCFLLLLSKHKSLLAYIGALVMIATIAIDPFSQQIIQYNSCPQIAIDHVASIPVINNYTAAAMSNSLGDTSAAVQGILNQEMSAAIYTGLVNPLSNATVSIPITCGTGNCTFPSSPSDGATYQTLGFATECKDITILAADMGSTTDKYNTSMTDAYSMPGFHGGNMSIARGSFEFPLASFNATYFEEPESIVRFNMLMMHSSQTTCGSSDIARTNSSDECTPSMTPFAMECALFPTIRTYNASIINGLLIERAMYEERIPPIGGQWRRKGLLDEDFFPWTRIADRTLRDGSWYDCAPTQAQTANNTVLAYPDQLPTDYSDTNMSLAFYPENCVWLLDSPMNAALGATLSSLFYEKKVELVNNLDGTQYLSGDPWLLKLYKYGSPDTSTVSDLFHGLGEAMSSSLRAASLNGTRRFIKGEALSMQTCVVVQWWWMSFLVFLTVACLFFTFTVYLQSNKDHSGTGSWKSFTLAELFAGLDEKILKEHGRLDHKSQMEEAASRMLVRRVLTEFGWRLSQVEN